jgi:hypothetical protein
LSFNAGFTSLPQGIYFDTLHFSVSLWIYPINFWPYEVNDVRGPWSPILDFNGDIDSKEDYSSRIVINMGDVNNNFFPSLQVFELTDPYNFYTWSSSLPLTPYTWQLIAFTYDGINVSWFINGTSAGSSSQPNTFSSVTRTTNFFGKDYRGQKYLIANVDDIRFYSICLGQSQINDIIYTDDTTLTYLTTTTSTTSTTTTTKPLMDSFLTHQWRFKESLVDSVSGSGYNLMAAGKSVNNA